MRSFTKEIKDVTIDLPVVNKILLCFPLRLGLIAWGLLQLVATIVITVYACFDFAEKAPHYHGFTLVQMIVWFVIIMIVSLLETIFCGFLTLGAKKKNPNFLEVCYHYLKAKVVVYAGLLIFCFFVSNFMYSDNWFYYNMDPWRGYILNYNLALGALDWILQLYLLICVRSELLKLQHIVDLPSLYKRLNANTEDPLWQHNIYTIQEEPTKQPLPDVI